MKKANLTGLFGALSLALCAQSQAATFNVTNRADGGSGGCTAAGAGDGCSLREAITAANSTPGADTVTFAPGLSGFISSQSGEYPLTTDITIQGPGRDVLSLSGESVARLFRIAGGVKVNLSGLNISDGKGLPAYSGGPTVGGGILNGGLLSLKDCLFENHRADYGAAVFNTLGQVSIENCVFKSNTSHGGAVVNWATTSPTGGSLTVKKSVFEGNRADFKSGAITNEAGNTLAVSDTYFLSNLGQQGSAIYNAGNLTLTGSTFHKNSASYNASSSGTLFNESVASGGGSSSGGVATVRLCTFFGNTGSVGAGIVNKGNVNTGNANSAGAQLTVQSSTFAEPTGGYIGNAVRNLSGGVARLRSNIFQARQGDQVPNANLFNEGSMTSDGFNLSSDSATGILTAPTDKRETQAYLGELKDNGGPVLTCALQGNSPARDKGLSTGLATDARGLSRVYDVPGVTNAPGGDGSDIGAFEVQLSETPQSPTVVSALPSSGSTQQGTPLEITMVYRDVNGADDISAAMINVVGSLNTPSGFAARYEGGQLYLASNNGGKVGPAYVGSGTLLTSANANLDCSKTTVTKSGNDLTIKWHFIVGFNETGTKNIFGLAENKFWPGSGWVQVGTRTFEKGAGSAPASVSVTPASDSGAPDFSRFLTSVHRDSNGAGDITDVRLLLNGELSAANGLIGRYFNGRLYLANDAGSFIGGFAPGSQNIITNSQGRLDCSATRVTASGTDLTIQWVFTPFTSFLGTKKIYALVADRSGLSQPWTLLGTWTVERAPSGAPVNLSLSPANAASPLGHYHYVTTVHRDSNGASDLEEIRLLANSTLTAANGLMMVYKNGKLYLADDAGTGLIGGFAPGTENTISNSQGSLSCLGTRVSGSETNLSIQWSFVAKPDFKGVKNLYVRATDRDGLKDGWDLLGTWKPGASVPTNVSLSPSSGSGQAGVAKIFTVRYRDLDGAAEINDARIATHSGFDSDDSGTTNALGARYHNGLLYLYSGRIIEGRQLGSGYAPGSANQITSPYGSLDCSKTTVTREGNDLVINWCLTVTNAFVDFDFGGGKDIFTRVGDSTGLLTRWTKMGSWKVYGSQGAKASAAAVEAQTPSGHRG